jgi:hypothetical protein
MKLCSSSTYTNSTTRKMSPRYNLFGTHIFWMAKSPMSAERGSFWFRDIMKFCDHIRGIANATIGPGDMVLLWGYVWNGHHLMSELSRI